MQKHDHKKKHDHKNKYEHTAKLHKAFKANKAHVQARNPGAQVLMSDTTVSTDPKGGFKKVETLVHEVFLDAFNDISDGPIAFQEAERLSANGGKCMLHWLQLARDQHGTRGRHPLSTSYYEDGKNMFPEYTLGFDAALPEAFYYTHEIPTSKTSRVVVGPVMWPVVNE